MVLVKGFVSRLLKAFAKAIIAILVTSVVVGIICWIGNWRSWGAYKNGLMIVGLGFLVVGGFSTPGKSAIRGSISYKYASGIGSRSSKDRDDEDMGLTEDPIGFTVWLISIGLVLAFGSFYI